MVNFLALVAERFIEILLGKIVDGARNYFAERSKRKTIEDDAKRDSQKLKDATTGKEIDDAADDSLNHL